ncbi:MAG: hypothetical protein GY729_13415 [Desulfobacteraceae bacterium]|nr:hypothetical protein [Desulfobacteraceae bacterium]
MNSLLSTIPIPILASFRGFYKEGIDSQKTYTQKKLDLELLARSCGFENTARVHGNQQLKEVVQDFEHQGKLSFIHVVIKPGNSSCPNIPLKPQDITKRFKTCLEN